MKAWHFVNEEKTLRDGNTVAAGYVYRVDGPLKLCAWGLHASINPLDALNYAPGPIICRVEMGGEIHTTRDKCVAETREVLWMADADQTLRHFARLCALDVIHLWEAPDVVVLYLKTGDKSLREASWAASREASRVASDAASRVAHKNRLTKMLNELAP